MRSLRSLGSPAARLLAAVGGLALKRLAEQGLQGGARRVEGRPKRAKVPAKALKIWKKPEEEEPRATGRFP